MLHSVIFCEVAHLLQVNRICLWKLSLEPEDDTMDGTGLVDRGVQEAQPVCEMPHVGDVTGLEVNFLASLTVTKSYKT